MLNNITFQEWTKVTLDPLFLIFIGIVWFVPIFIYLIYGALAPATTPSGHKLQKRAIQTANFWFAFIDFFFIQLILLIIFIIYPIWLWILN